MSAGAPPRRGLPALGTEFAWIASPHGALAIDTALRAALGAAGLLDLAALRCALAAGGGGAGRAPTAALALPDAPLVLRALRRGGWLGPWLGGALLGPARPFRELAVTAALRAAGAPVPRPALAAAWRCGVVWNAAVATRREVGAVDAAEFLATRPARARWARALRAAGRAVRRFHDAGGWHADLHVANLLVRETAGACEVLVIDLDGARMGAPPGPGARTTQLMRLYRSLRKRGLLEVVGERGCAAFFGAYLAGDRGLRRAMRAGLAAERRRVALHALLYRPARAPRARP